MTWIFFSFFSSTLVFRFHNQRCYCQTLLFPLLATSATVSATFDVTSSLTKYAAFDFGVGDISIQKSASFSLINTFDCAFQGDINIEKDCEFLIASTAKALKLTFNNIFHKIENKGKWIVHTLESAAASTCNIIVKSFVNTGEIILAFKGHVLAPIINITASHWVNHGCLHLFKKSNQSLLPFWVLLVAQLKTMVLFV